MPAQKNCVPSVVMNEGMPTLAMIRPLMKPTRIPDARPATTASQPRSYSLNRTAKTKPEKAMIDGKAEVDFAGPDDEGEAGGEQDQRRQGGEEGRVDIGRKKHFRRQVHEQRQQQHIDDDDRQASTRCKNDRPPLRPSGSPTPCAVGRSDIRSAPSPSCPSDRFRRRSGRDPARPAGPRPRAHARDCARYRCRRARTALILRTKSMTFRTSATPSAAVGSSSTMRSAL